MEGIIDFETPTQYKLDGHFIVKTAIPKTNV